MTEAQIEAAARKPSPEPEYQVIHNQRLPPGPVLVLFIRNGKVVGSLGDMLPEPEPASTGIAGAIGVLLRDGRARP